MKRVVETKFNKFVMSMLVKEQHETVVLYHGSNTEFDEFDENKISTGDGGDLFGKGFYLTSNIEVAKFYAHQMTMKDRVKEYKPIGIFKSYVPIFHDDAEEHAKSNAKINVFKIDGNFLNCKTYIIDAEFRKVITDAHIKYSGWKEAGERIVNKTFDFLKDNKSNIHNYRGELEYIISQLVLGNADMLEAMMSYIRSLGYDGIKYESDKSYEGEGSWNYVIWNRHVIKTHKTI
jgi:hypothetical protein